VPDCQDKSALTGATKLPAMSPLPFRLIRRLFLALVLTATTGSALAGRQERVDMSTLVTPVYTVDGDGFVRHNGDRYSNRSLYCNHIYAAAFGGDKPVVLLGNGRIILGNLMFALVRSGTGRWLQDAADITSIYRPGRMEWTVKDPVWGGTAIHIDAVPAAEGAGMAVRISVEDARPGDKLAWASGGARRLRQDVLWEYDMISQKTDLMHRGFVPDDCKGNTVTVDSGTWTIGMAGNPVATGQCSDDTNLGTSDASKWSDAAALVKSTGQDEPIARGCVPITSNQNLYWSLTQPSTAPSQTPAAIFATGMSRERSIENQVVVNTPDAWLNAAVGASEIVTDACFREDIYTHSGMRWAKALLGWRTVFGGTVFGSHDNVMADARKFIASQLTESPNTSPKADSAMELSSQASDSRIFGKGRITLDNPHHYDMQSQFFDQMEHAWRWTGNADMEKLLRPALELHCEYLKDCFDPAGLGIYESYANTWPTDDQWYNGGGTSEETAYAYKAEDTALLMAQQARDVDAIKLHSAAAAHIRHAFFELLWDARNGHPGSYREQGGLKRLHDDPWLYGIFCPIDAGLLTAEQAAESLEYTETSLERITMPYGGQQCWPSNWVPSIWSVREMWGGDNYQLALAYFQAGLADDGWAILRGTFPQQMLFGMTPGDMGNPAGGTDFNDCNSVFARAVVEGLFGYRPDYPEEVVTVAPQFPSTWDHASITTPDMSMTYSRTGADIEFKVTVTKPAPLTVRLPVSTHSVTSVTINGRPAPWRMEPGFGRTIVRIDLPPTNAADIAISTADTLPIYTATHLSGDAGAPLTLAAQDGKITQIHDPEGVLSNATLTGGHVAALLNSNPGHHSVFALTTVGATPQWRIFQVDITDRKADQALAAKTTVPIPPNAQWSHVPMQSALNGDIRTIYQQQYLSPRPNTSSLRLATDGYNTWQMVLAKNHTPPEITLDNLGALSDGKGNILAGSGVPFQLPASGNNIAFTSQWDNWPRKIDVPVNQNGQAVWFLLCGTTNPMEVRIANAELRMTYADGVVEKLEIVPPFNFWTLCPIGGVDYDYTRDAFALPKVPPTTVQLGQNCRAILLGWNLRPGVPLRSVTLQSLSQQVVIGLMGVTVMNAK
jgi:hypothetical protein